MPRNAPGQDDSIWPIDRSSISRRASRVAWAVGRIAAVMLWTIIAGLAQAMLLKLPGRGNAVFARLYWHSICVLIGVRVRVIGYPLDLVSRGRPTVFVANHSSWLDIAVLGGQLEACFIAKNEVARWPLINVIAWLGRTVFVFRRRGSTARERDGMRDRLAAGDNLILFPEATTSDGSRVLPFRSAFFSIAEHPVSAGGKPPLVQPVSVAYDRIAYLPTGRANRALFAWYGDMAFGPHVWRVAQQRGLRATVLLHAPLDPAHFADRKALAKAVWTTVATGAATLRQNRTAWPR